MKRIAPKITNLDRLEIIVYDRMNAFTRRELCQRYQLGYETLIGIFAKHPFSETDINKAIAAYKEKALKEFGEKKSEEISLRAEIIKKGLIRLDTMLTHNKDLEATKISSIVSQTQKDLWTSLGQPTSISKVSQLSDEMLNLLINLIEKNNNELYQREPILVREGDFESLAPAEPAVVKCFSGGEEEKEDGMEN